MLDYTSNRLGSFADFCRDKSIEIFQRLAVWLVIGNIAAVGLLISLAAKDFNGIELASYTLPIVLFLASAGGAFFGLFVFSLYLGVYMVKSIRLQTEYQLLKLHYISSEDMDELKIKYNDAHNAGEFKRLSDNAAKALKDKETEIQSLIENRWLGILISSISYALFALSAIGFGFGALKTLFIFQ